MSNACAAALDGEAGFTLIEVLIATLLMTVILGGAGHGDGAMAAELESRHRAGAARRAPGAPVWTASPPTCRSRR